MLIQHCPKDFEWKGGTWVRQADQLLVINNGNDNEKNGMVAEVFAKVEHPIFWLGTVLVNSLRKRDLQLVVGLSRMIA